MEKDLWTSVLSGLINGIVLTIALVVLAHAWKRYPPQSPQYEIICQKVDDGNVTMTCVATPVEEIK